MRWRLVLRFARNLYRRYGAEAAVAVASRVFALDPYAQAALNTAIAVTNMPGRAFPGTGGYKRRRGTDYSADPSAYQQVSYARYKDGGSRHPSVNQLVKANIYRRDFWFKGVKSFDTNGYYWMDKGQPSLRNYPVYLFAPFHATQSFSGTFYVPNPMRRLYQNITTGAFRTDSVNGYNSSGGLSTGINYADTNSNNSAAMGPQGCIKWTEFKFNLWGAKNKSTRYTIAWMRSKTGDTCPFRYASTASVDDRLAGEIMEYVRPKVVNPISTANDIASSDWQVLKSYVFDIDPIDLQEGDNDPHVKQVTIFNRWNRILRFDYTTASTATEAQQVTEMEAPTVNYSETVGGVVNIRPQDDKDVWLMITATNYTPFSPDNTPTNTVDPSFDMSFRSSWSRLGL